MPFFGGGILEKRFLCAGSVLGRRDLVTILAFSLSFCRYSESYYTITVSKRHTDSINNLNTIESLIAWILPIE